MIILQLMVIRLMGADLQRRRRGGQIAAEVGRHALRLIK